MCTQLATCAVPSLTFACIPYHTSLNGILLLLAWQILKFKAQWLLHIPQVSADKMLRVYYRMLSGFSHDAD